jgi:snRNA-activating protein complex subunit 1
VDVQDIKHISEDKKLIGDEMAKIIDDWNVQRDVFNQQRGFSQQPPEEQQQLLLLQQEEPQQHQDDEEFDPEDDEDFNQNLERLLSKG